MQIAVKLRLYHFILGVVLVFGQCTKEIVLSDEKEMLSFTLREVTVTTQWDGQTLYLIAHEPIDKITVVFSKP